MPTITGHIKNGTIVLDTPLPADWPEGTQVTLARSETADEAWLADHIKNSTFPEELEQILKDAKAEELSLWEAHNRKIEGLFS